MYIRIIKICIRDTMICEIAKANNPEDLKSKINELLDDDFILVSVTVATKNSNDEKPEYVAWLFKDDKLKKLIRETHKKEIEKLNLLKEQSNKLKG